MLPLRSLQSSAQKLQRSALAHRFKSAATVEQTTSRTGQSAAAASSASQTAVPIATCLGAAVLGICTVSVAAAVVENATAGSTPRYDPKGQRFDQSNFAGRFSRMLLACDPRLLLYSQDEIDSAQRMLLDYENSGVQDRVLWEARRMVDASLNGDDVVPHPFRMSGYVPFNGPICVAMVASQSTPALLFWSWVNQSQNALVNYFNRNASSPMTNEVLLKSYAVAVGSALAVAFGLATAIQKRYDPVRAKALLRWVAFPSAVVASSLNCYIVRSPEMDSGVPLLDANGNDVLPGTTSKVAAAQGVYSTTASRALLQAPVYFLPPLLLTLKPFQKYLARNPAHSVPLTTYLLLVCFGVGLPATVAIFPQMAELSPEQVEEPYRHLRNARNEPYPVFYFNKGL